MAEVFETPRDYLDWAKGQRSFLSREVRGEEEGFIDGKDSVVYRDNSGKAVGVLRLTKDEKMMVTDREVVFRFSVFVAKDDEDEARGIASQLISRVDNFLPGKGEMDVDEVLLMASSLPPVGSREYGWLTEALVENGYTRVQMGPDEEKNIEYRKQIRFADVDESNRVSLNLSRKSIDPANRRTVLESRKRN